MRKNREKILPTAKSNRRVAMSKIKKTVVSAVCAAVMLLAFGCGEPKSPSKEPDVTEQYPLYVSDIESISYSAETYAQKMSSPFWLSNVMYNEIAVPFEYEDGSVYANLMYAPERVVSVMDQQLKVTYEEGKDYTVDKANKRLVIPAGSAIVPLYEKADEGVNPPEGNYELVTAPPGGLAMPDSVSKYVIWNNGGGPFVYTECSYFYGKYLSVTYAYDVSELPKSVFNRHDKTMLAGVRNKLKAGNDISMVVLGDSISAGSSSTSDLKVEPNTPSYSEQVKAELERVYGAKVDYTNVAKGGSMSDYPLGEGAAALAAAKAAKPDLCIIAYGMNDLSGTTPAKFQSNIEETMLAVKSESRDCNFILVNSFPCNDKFVGNVYETLGKYRAKLNELQEKYNDGSVTVIDMLAPGEHFLTRKKFCEISSSNVNHPNDFMHRVYAMNIMTAICDYKN